MSALLADKKIAKATCARLLTPRPPTPIFLKYCSTARQAQHVRLQTNNARRRSTRRQRRRRRVRRGQSACPPSHAPRASVCLPSLFWLFHLPMPSLPTFCYIAQSLTLFLSRDRKSQTSSSSSVDGTVRFFPLFPLMSTSSSSPIPFLVVVMGSQLKRFSIRIDRRDQPRQRPVQVYQRGEPDA